MVWSGALFLLLTAIAKPRVAGRFYRSLPHRRTVLSGYARRRGSVSAGQMPQGCSALAKAGPRWPAKTALLDAEKPKKCESAKGRDDGKPPSITRSPEAAHCVLRPAVFGSVPSIDDPATRSLSFSWRCGLCGRWSAVCREWQGVSGLPPKRPPRFSPSNRRFNHRHAAF